MSESYWAYWLVLLGVVFTVIMMLIQGATTSNTQDYYQLKEITESSIVDSVDYAYYRLYGELKINREKFVENFLRRFAETVSITTQYQIDFYDLYEAPPKVSVRVKSMTNSLNVIGDETSFDIVNKLDAILEMSEDTSQCSYYTDGGGSSNNSSQNNNSSGNNNNNSNNVNNGGSSADNNSANNSRVPSGTAAIAHVITYGNHEREKKYYNCDYRNHCTIKNEYRCNTDKFANDLLEDYQKLANVKFTEDEKKQFLNNINEMTKTWEKDSCD